MKTVAIIGGGAAGLAAAISVDQVADSDNTRVVIYEAADRVGKSILATGNGRCNFSNLRVKAEDYYNPDFVRKVFEAVSPQEVLNWFSQMGLFWTQEAEGRLYPATLKAHSVLDVLRVTARNLGVVEKVNCEVNSITPVQDHFLIALKDDPAEQADVVIVSCGHHIARHLLPSTHLFKNIDPMLCPLQTDIQSIKGLDNIRVRAGVSLDGFYEEGEVLFRSYGVSGIVVFNASRFARKGHVLHLDLLPQMTSEEIIDRIAKINQDYPSRKMAELFIGLLHPRLIEAIRCKACLGNGVPSEADLILFTETLKAFPLVVVGIGDSKQAQVFRGGFNVDDFNASTMQSLHVPGLYLAGESLDIDGPCGGFNLHWAWASGILAGRSAVRAV